MTSGRFGVARRQIARLFEAGTVAGLSERQVLDRFVATRDDVAFEAIVARHGPMVLGVCRSFLRDPNDVDDAFQATFLVLARRAGSIHRGDLLGNWLHGVARRVALRARAVAAARRGREGDGPEPTVSDPDDRDLRVTIHAEVDRLPASYRAAVVLCYFEGRTHEEAALELGWPIGTVKGRLARARALLRDRLTRRGLAPASAALIVSLAAEGRAAVPPLLLDATTAAGPALAAGSLATATARAVALYQGVSHAMIATKLKIATTLFVAAGVLTGPGVSAFQGPGDGPPAPASRPGAMMQAASRPDRPIRADKSSAEARIKLAESAIHDLQRLVKDGAVPQIYEPLLRWERRLAEARIDAGMPRAEAARAYLDAAKAAEEAVKTQFKNGEATPIVVAEAEFHRLEAQTILERPEPAPTPTPSAMFGGMGGSMGEQRAALEPGRAKRLVIFADITNELQNEERFPRPRKQHPSDIERNKAIEAALERVVPMHFTQETPLEDVLKYIRESSKGSKGEVMPIYADPIGLQEAERTLQSPVTLDLDGVPLSTTLRLLLRQLGLDYVVRDGLLKIGDMSSIAENRNGERFWDAVERAGALTAPPDGPGDGVKKAIGASAAGGLQ